MRTTTKIRYYRKAFRSTEEPITKIKLCEASSEEDNTKTIYNDNLYVMRCTISYHLYNLKNVKNTHGGMLLLVTCQLY